MERWAGRVAVVTGASSGIGAALAKALTKHGMKVAALARREDKLKKLQEGCKAFKGSMMIYKCDISVENEIALTFKSIVRDLGAMSILINNAAIAQWISLTDVSQGSAREMYETNVLGLVTCTQHALTIMKENGITDGHIININSICGSTIMPISVMANYSATKHAVSALSEYLKDELSSLNYDTRVTDISPGLVKTDMPKGLLEQKGKSMNMLEVSDVVDCIIFVLSVRQFVNISKMIVQSVREKICDFK